MNDVLARVMVTGGSGMVGRNLTELLERRGWEYYAPTRAEMDLLDYSVIAKVLGRYKPDIVVHCAGVVGGISANVVQPYAFCDQNAQMGMNVVRASAAGGVQRLLNLASSCMYPAQAPNPLKESAILTGSLEPTNEGYAIAKILVAKLCEYISKVEKLKYKTVIPCNLYGKFDHFEATRSHMIPGVIVKLYEALQDGRSEVEVWGDGTARREFMYAGDLADFLLHAIEDFDRIASVMNVGLGFDFSINDYYEEIAKVVGYKGDYVHDLSKPTGMKQKLVDVTLQDKIGWAPSSSLTTGLKKTFEYFLEENR